MLRKDRLLQEKRHRWKPNRVPKSQSRRFPRLRLRRDQRMRARRHRQPRKKVVLPRQEKHRRLQRENSSNTHLFLGGYPIAESLFAFGSQNQRFDACGPAKLHAAA